MKNGNISLLQVLIMILIQLNLLNKIDLKLEMKIKLLVLRSIRVTSEVAIADIYTLRCQLYWKMDVSVHLPKLIAQSYKSYESKMDEYDESYHPCT